MTARWMALLAAGLSIPAWGQSKPRVRFALTASQVVRTLTNQGIQVANEEVTLPAYVVASEPDPVLDEVSVGTIGVQHVGDQSVRRSWVKLACHEPGTCLPFYAIVTVPELADKPGIGMAGASLNADSAILKPKIAITIRVGAHATLVMDDSRSHIQVVVVSLENGVVGQKIHVASPDHKQVYVAEVITAILLKRSL